MAAIAEVEVFAVGPEVARFTWADQPPQYLTWVLVQLRDDEGGEGFGLTVSYSRDRFDLSVFESLRHRVKQLIAADAAAPEAVSASLEDLNIPIAPGTLSVLDIALWDLHAKRANLPLHRLLGGAQAEVLAYASTPQLETADEYVALVEELAGQGIRAIKFHAWNDPERDLKMLRRVVAEHGSRELLLMHDAEMRYDRQSALRVGRELEELGFHWFEAPLVDQDLEGYRRLRRQLSIPIIPAGHWIIEPHEFARALSYEPWERARFDVTVAGGITRSRVLLALAVAHGLDVEVQSWGPTVLQAANLHFSLGFGHANHFELPIPVEPYEFGVIDGIRPNADGYVTAPAGPGLGVALDWEKINHATLGAYRCSSRGLEELSIPE